MVETIKRQSNFIFNLGKRLSKIKRTIKIKIKVKKTKTLKIDEHVSRRVRT